MSDANYLLFSISLFFIFLVFIFCGGYRPGPRSPAHSPAPAAEEGKR